MPNSNDNSLRRKKRNNKHKKTTNGKSAIPLVETKNSCSKDESTMQNLLESSESTEIFNKMKGVLCELSTLISDNDTSGVEGDNLKSKIPSEERKHTASTQPLPRDSTPPEVNLDSDGSMEEFTIQGITPEEFMKLTGGMESRKSQAAADTTFDTGEQFNTILNKTQKGALCEPKKDNHDIINKCSSGGSTPVRPTQRDAMGMLMETHRSKTDQKDKNDLKKITSYSILGNLMSVFQKDRTENDSANKIQCNIDQKEGSQKPDISQESAKVSLKERAAVDVTSKTSDKSIDTINEKALCNKMVATSYTTYITCFFDVVNSHYAGNIMNMYKENEEIVKIGEPWMNTLTEIVTEICLNTNDINDLRSKMSAVINIARGELPLALVVEMTKLWAEEHQINTSFFN